MSRLDTGRISPQGQEGVLEDSPAASRSVNDSPTRDSVLWLRDQLAVVAVAVLLTLFLRACVVEPYRIPSESMLPTLHAGDHVFVSKWVYGAPLPFTAARMPEIRAPERGDVVVFEVGRLGNEIAPRDVRPDLPVERFVKRVIGLPGDEIARRDGLLWVNGKPADAWPTGEIYVDEAGRRLAGWREEFAGESHALLQDRFAPAGDFSLVVPDGRYFMMGDHRDHSSDSRLFGTVPRDDLIGPVAFVYWSWDASGVGSSDGALGRWQRALGSTRWGRVGETIE